MVNLERDCVTEFLAQAEQCYPRECCGLLAGTRKDLVWHVEAIFPLCNMQPEGVLDSYSFDPKERCEKELEIQKNGLELIGFYHSHPDHGVYFSQRDLENSEEYQFGEPWLKAVYAYLIVSVQEGVAKDFGIFLVDEGKSKSIHYQILEQGMQNHVC